MIELVNVTKTFDQKVVLSNLNATFQDGNINIILGKNGIGKSTLLDCIARPYYLDKGKILLNGKKIDALDIRKEIFYLPSYTFMEEDLSAIEYLSFVSYIYNDIDFEIEEFEEIICELDLTNAMNDLIDTFSVGMKKKLYFISSMVSSADNLIYDELFSGIDVKSTKYILKKLEDFKNDNKCIVMSTHNVKLIESVSDKFFELKSKDTLLEQDSFI